MHPDTISRVVHELQNLTVFDGLTILLLAGLESILSVDNALVLALMVRTLPKPQRKRALTYGILGAFLFRIIAVLSASWFMKLWYFKLGGGIYLLYLAMKHMFFSFGHAEGQHSKNPPKSFWLTVVLVELTDLAFSIDSITTAVAMTNKIIIVWLGGVMGIICLRFMSNYFVKLLDKLPKLEDLAYQIVFFVGIKLSLSGLHIEIDDKYFWLMMGVISTIGISLVWQDHKRKKSKKEISLRLLERFENEEIDVGELLNFDDIPKAIIDYLKDKGFIDIKEGSSRK